MERIRGRSRTTLGLESESRSCTQFPRPPEFALQIHDGNAECGCTFDSSDEHLAGTSKGVVKCRSITSLPDTRRFSADAIDSMRRVPWMPPTQHVGARIRAHIPEEDEEVMEDNAECDDIHVRRDDDDYQDDRIQQVEGARRSSRTACQGSRCGQIHADSGMPGDANMLRARSTHSVDTHWRARRG